MPIFSKSESWKFEDIGKRVVIAKHCVEYPEHSCADTLWVKAHIGCLVMITAVPTQANGFALYWYNPSAYATGVDMQTGEICYLLRRDVENVGEENSGQQLRLI